MADDQVTNSSMKAFRSEILLTAQLRHPNIVNFVGACWGEDLTCLVLEWVGKGSLTQVGYELQSRFLLKTTIFVMMYLLETCDSSGHPYPDNGFALGRTSSPNRCRCGERNGLFAPAGGDYFASNLFDTLFRMVY